MKNTSKNNLKRLMFLMEYNSNKDKKIINEHVDVIIESKQTQAQALNILKKGGVEGDENTLNKIIEQFRGFDQTKNEILLPIIAVSFSELYSKDNNKDISGIINKIQPLYLTISELIRDNKIRKILTTNTNNYVVDDKTFNDYVRFSEYIHGLESLDKGAKEYKDQLIDVKTNEKPLYSGGNITVYDGNEVGKCIKYSGGELTGKTYSFCIGQPNPSQNMWLDYRTKYISTFYYVVDSNKELSDPLHIVVVDVREDGVVLTDDDNRTGDISEFGSDTESYFDYLKSKGVPTDKLFVNKPRTEQEIETEHLIGSKNPSLDWFKSLGYKNQMLYIGRGHQLSDEQFDYLWSLYEKAPAAYDLLAKYVDTGLPLPETQFKKLVGDE